MARKKATDAVELDMTSEDPIPEPVLSNDEQEMTELMQAQSGLEE